MMEENFHIDNSFEIDKHPKRDNHLGSPRAKGYVFTDDNENVSPGETVQNKCTLGLGLTTYRDSPLISKYLDHSRNNLRGKEIKQNSTNGE